MTLLLPRWLLVRFRSRRKTEAAPAPEPPPRPSPPTRMTIHAMTVANGEGD